MEQFNWIALQNRPPYPYVPQPSGSGQEHSKDIYNVTKQTAMDKWCCWRKQGRSWLPDQVNPYKEKEKCGTF